MAAFPVQLAEVRLEVTAFSGDEVIAGAHAGDAVNELIDVAAAHGVTISDFAIASAAVRAIATPSGQTWASSIASRLAS